MPSPRVFVSSTYFDLRHVRAAVEGLITSYGFEPVLFERGTIAYDPRVSLVESGFREIESCHILVMIIGGRYGTVTGERLSRTGERGEFAASVTLQEYRKAFGLQLPTYSFVDRATWAEYDVWTRNRGLTAMRFAHAEARETFELLDFVKTRDRNNALFVFDEVADIVGTLRRQWSGLFYELLIAAREQGRLRVIEAALADLRATAARLEAYTERIVRDVGSAGAEGLIEGQRRAGSEQRLERLFADWQTSAMGRFVGRFRSFAGPAEWAELMVRQPDVRSFLYSVGVPDSEIEYVTSRATAQDVFKATSDDVRTVLGSLEADGPEALS